MTRANSNPDDPTPQREGSRQGVGLTDEPESLPPDLMQSQVEQSQDLEADSRPSEDEPAQQHLERPRRRRQDARQKSR
jgi:hypothetical protein